MATYANCQYDMVQHHSTNQSANTRPKVVEYLSSRFLRPSLNIYFRKLIPGGTPSIIITTPLHHYEQEHLESRLAKS